VALVDDVITTGATANECARVLRDFGAREVWAVAFARADPAAAHGGDA
jgi:predicted amidophosphoribosyltransferase